MAATISPALWEALRGAVLWAHGEWERVIEHAAGAEEAAGHLAQIASAIRVEACGMDASAVSVPRNPLSRRLLGLVRGDFLERVKALAPPDPAQLLRLLAAMEE